MAVPYHTHTFEIPAATKAEIEAGVRDDVTATPASLGSAATKDVAYFATASQGGSADTAVQSVNGKTGKEISLTKADIDLASVDDTSDLNKPISTAQQAEFNLKADTSALGSAAYEDATVFASASQGAKADSAVQSINGKTGAAITLAKSDVGLGSVDNTADLNKPISTATQTALNSKATTDQGAKADSALQAAGGSTGQVLIKNSDVINDVVWATSEAATAVSYAPQTLTTAQKIQARENIDVQPVTTTTVGAAIAGANGKQTPADGDFFTGGEAGGSAMFKTTWGNIKAALKNYFDMVYYWKPTGNTSQYIQGNGSLATMNAAAVGLGNVANISDANKPISTATQSALNGKAGVYTGSSPDEINFPIGHTIQVKASVARNALISPRLYGNDAYENGGSGALLTGVWRQRGANWNSPSIQLAERVS